MQTATFQLMCPFEMHASLLLYDVLKFLRYLITSSYVHNYQNERLCKLLLYSIHCTTEHVDCRKIFESFFKQNEVAADPESGDITRILIINDFDLENPALSELSVLQKRLLSR
jgi:hypothetical protein